MLILDSAKISKILFSGLSDKVLIKKMGPHIYVIQSLET